MEEACYLPRPPDPRKLLRLVPGRLARTPTSRVLCGPHRAPCANREALPSPGKAARRNRQLAI